MGHNRAAIPPRPGVAANRTAERELKLSPEHIQ